MKDNVKIIASIRRAITRQKIRDAQEIRAAKRQAAKEAAEFALFMDDCIESGIDIRTQEGRALAIHGWLIKLTQLRREPEESVLTNGNRFLMDDTEF